MVTETERPATGPFVDTILADVRVCTGCLACELACGFRWSKAMNPAASMVRVFRDESNGTIEIKILEGCDACAGIETPPCVNVCTPHALSLGRKRRTEAANP